MQQRILYDCSSLVIEPGYKYPSLVTVNESIAILHRVGEAQDGKLLCVVDEESCGANVRMSA